MLTLVLRYLVVVIINVEQEHLCIKDVLCIDLEACVGADIIVVSRLRNRDTALMSAPMAPLRKSVYSFTQSDAK